MLKIINSMGAKTCSRDPVPSSVLRELAPYIIRQITTIVNVSLREGVFAYKWKTAIIKPLLKKVGLALITRTIDPLAIYPSCLN